MTELIEVPPACFGAASVFSHDSEICQGCVGYQGCGAASLKTLESIKGIINVEDLMKRHVKARKLTVERLKERDEEREASMPPGNIEQPITKKPVERKTEVATVKFEVNEDEDALIARMPSKAKDKAVVIVKRGLLSVITNRIAEKGVFSDLDVPACIKVALTKLVSGGFTRSELTSAYELELGWSKGTASSHTSQVVKILTIFPFAQEKDGRIVPFPAVSA